MEEIKLLYVDDALNHLSSFKASFRFDYKILVAQSTTEAIELMAQHPDIGVVICDQDMPNKSGADFLEEVQYRFPRPVRMLLSGLNDMGKLVDAVNKGHVFRYIKKPWSEIEMRNAIDEAIKLYKTNLLLIKKNDELQDAYALLNEFAYNVTHGLRDPILSVLSMVEIAQHMKDVNDDVKEILDMVGHAMIQLDNYIENTRDYHQLKNNSMQMGNVWFSDIMNNLSDLYEDEAEKKNIKYTVSIEQQVAFAGNESLLRIIISNILSNAFKYQKKNGTNKFVSIDIKVTEEEATILVKDNGIGIAPAYINNIFEPLYRATSYEYGSGLGLYNVKDALNKQKGEIFVESELNVGSTFKVVLNNKKI
jgi:signal transduction histidine kinase